MFAAGYNMRRKEFFKNFTNIVKFGIFGSLFTFVIFVFLTWCLFNQPYFDIDVWNPDTKTKEIFSLDLLEIMLICSILVSSDIIAAMAILNFNEQPHIFSIILGEGLFNDVVVIVLYQTVVQYKEDEGTKAFDFQAICVIVGSFIGLCIFSSAFGIAMGLIITYILKKFRFLSHSAI